MLGGCLFVSSRPENGRVRTNEKELTMSVKSLRLDPVGLGFVTLSSTLVIQMFHNVEHVIQMLQKYVSVSYTHLTLPTSDLV